jgi:hypothetical protein
MSNSKGAVGIDVFPGQRRQSPEIGFGQSALPMGLGENLRVPYMAMPLPAVILICTSQFSSHASWSGWLLG